MSLWYHKTDSYKWIHGSIREDLEPDERSVWADLLALGGLTREGRRGYIERSEGMPYRKNQLVVMLNITEELFDRSIAKCVNEGRLTIFADGTMLITNWNNYNNTDQFEEKRAKKLAASVAKSQNAQKSKTKDTILDCTVRALNENNKCIKTFDRKVRYMPDGQGGILDTTTGEVIPISKNGGHDEKPIQ